MCSKTVANNLPKRNFSSLHCQPLERLAESGIIT